MTQKSRSELKELFKTGAKPSQEDFANFIESTLNIKEDGIEKPSGANTPLKITAQDTDEKLLDFYSGETKTWSINQKPGEEKIGLNISNAGGSKLFIDSSNGNVGLSIDQPTAKLHIQQTGNEDALRIDDQLNDTTPFLIDKDGNVGIGTTTTLTAKLEVNGSLKVQDVIDAPKGIKIQGETDHINVDGAFYRNQGEVYLTVNNHLYIRDTQSSKKIHFQTDTGSLTLDGSLSLGGNLAINGNLAIKGVMSGTANDYQKAQFALSGGGTVTWGGHGGRLKWTKRFIAVSMEKGATFSQGAIEILQPTEEIPANNVWQNKARSANADGVILNNWEALYAVHTVGGAQGAVSYRIVQLLSEPFEAPSNWVLVAVVNGDNHSIKLGTGLILNKNTSSTNGSPIPVGVIMMWSGQVADIPDGWALCNGQNGTPNLQDRFIVGSGSSYSPGVTGGANTVTLKLNEIPSHNHDNGNFKYLLQFTKDGTLTGNSDKSTTEPNLYTKGAIKSAGGNGAHENRPPYYALCFIMKL